MKWKKLNYCYLDISFSIVFHCIATFKKYILFAYCFGRTNDFFAKNYVTDSFSITYRLIFYDWCFTNIKLTLVSRYKFKYVLSQRMV